MKQSIPQIQFGKYQISRLVMGANPMNGGSHLSRFVNNQMKSYFTPEQVQETLRQSEAAGINLWQSSGGDLEKYQQYIASGGNMHYISLGRASEERPDELARLAAGGTIGVAHHGEFTDMDWKSGNIAHTREYCKQVRDAGLMVGVSTHIPDVVDHIVSEDWDVDFFMCCVYERHRTRDELKALLGYVPIPEKEVYLEEDPARMFKAMRQTDKPCLAFKILAAGRLCDKQDWVEKAFEDSFSQMKPNDAVIVGMYPEYEDQITMNADYVRRFSHLSK